MGFIGINGKLTVCFFPKRFTLKSVKNFVRCTEDIVMERFVKSRLHCRKVLVSDSLKNKRTKQSGSGAAMATALVTGSGNNRQSQTMEFEPMTSCDVSTMLYKLNYEATRLGASQLVGLICFREGFDEWKEMNVYLKCGLWAKERTD